MTYFILILDSVVVAIVTRMMKTSIKFWTVQLTLKSTYFSERRQTVNIFIVPRQLENELLRNNLFENGVSTLSLENQENI